MTEPSAQQSKLHASRTTTELYRECMLLSEEARALLVQNEGMKRLGLNAQVLAAQTSSQGGSLEVIVSEIGRLSHAIRDVLEAMGDAARFLSQASIEVLHLSSLHASYELGLARGIDPGSAETYNRTRSGIRSRGQRHRAELRDRLRAVSGLVEDLVRYAKQMPPMTTMIQIVVSEATVKADELLGTVGELKAFHQHLDAKVEHMRRSQEKSFRHIQELDKEYR